MKVFTFFIGNLLLSFFLVVNYRYPAFKAGDAASGASSVNKWICVAYLKFVTFLATDLMDVKKSSARLILRPWNRGVRAHSYCVPGADDTAVASIGSGFNSVIHAGFSGKRGVLLRTQEFFLPA
jgi:hypothetical protein